MLFRRVTATLILALVSCLALPAGPQQNPLTKEQVINLVKNQFGDKTGARSIEQRGIDFEPTPDFLESLKDAGADAVFIQAVQNARRASSPSKKPLSQVQVLALLGGQVASHRVAMLVRERGIDFELKEDFLSDVSRSGGDQELLLALRSARVIKPTNVDPAAAALEAEVRQHVSRSIEFQQKGRFAESEREIRAALQLWPQNAVLLYDLGSVFQWEEKWDESITTLHEALRADPDNESAHAALGSALGRKHEYDGAAAELRQALHLDPNDDFAHYNLGVTLSHKNDHEGAITEYREAIRLNPKNASAHFSLGVRLEEKGDRKRALEEYRAAYTLVPSNESYKFNYEVLSRTQ